MNKFLWFLGGCATGLLAAAAISVLNEESSSSAPHDDDEDSELVNDTSTAEEASIFPGENFKAASGFFSTSFPGGRNASDKARTEEKTSSGSEPSEASA